MTVEGIATIALVLLTSGATLVAIGSLKGTVVERLDSHKSTLDDHEERLRGHQDAIVEIRAGRHKSFGAGAD